jgi:F0F1-type ATP synthase delta subunit
MQVRITKQNITERELAKALAGIATEENIVHEVHELLDRLVKADHPQSEEKVPEKYIRYICNQLMSDFKSLLIMLTENVDRWIEAQANPKRFLKSLRKADDTTPLILTQEQLDELKELIEAHFRSAIGLGFTANETTQKQWQKIGIKTPDIHLEEWIKHAYVAGRLADLLNDNSTFEEMMKLAKKLPLSRMDKLIIQMAQQNAAQFIKGYAEKAGNLATQVALDQQKKAINFIVQQYFAGNLKREPVGDNGFTASELKEAHRVISWRQLASELRNRFKQTDLVRDWERVAFTETRYATNLGRLMNAQIEGGGNPEEIYVYYHVLPTACASCKELYLNRDGTPKRFKLSEILANVLETGGMNVGRKASAIGQKDGWIPNASTHPNCHCYPVRVKEGYTHADE